jgi:hypothetical protein
MAMEAYSKAAHNQPCQRIAHDHTACVNVTGDPAACAPGCRPAPCRSKGDHPGGDHLNPRSEHYNGPILPGYREGEAWCVILALLPDTAETRVAVHHLVEAHRQAEKRAVRAGIDRDHGIRDAMERSQSCDHHGEEIKSLTDQVHGISAQLDRTERARIALLGFLHAVDEVVRGHPGEQGPGQLLSLLSALAGAVKKTRAAHDRAWRS